MTSRKKKFGGFEWILCLLLLLTNFSSTASEIRLYIEGKVQIPTLAQPANWSDEEGLKQGHLGVAYTLNRYQLSSGAVIISVKYC